MTRLPHRHLQETELEHVKTLLAKSPSENEAIELECNRATLLAELGRTEEAKDAYLQLLQRTPTHFGALNNFGNLLYATGYRTAARTVYKEAVKQHPDNPKGHVNLANLLAQNGEEQLALEHFEAALRLDPDHIEANRGLAYLLTELRDEEKAAFYRQKAFAGHPMLVLPYRGNATPITVLLLVSAYGGTIPMRHHLDDTVFQVTVVFVEYYDVTTPLLPHQLIFNAIGDADLCRDALEAASKILAITSAPVINRPEAVMATGRVDIANRLGTLPHVITPKTALLPRAMLESDNAVSRLADKGFAFPLLLRAPGFHTGRHFMLIENGRELEEQLPSLPGDTLLAIEYLDARSPDGKIRKYRVMLIGGKIFPLHAAVSHAWKIHYFTAEMADNPQHRAEDATFLEHMEQVLGPHAMKALQSICDMLGLEYAGIDFSLNAEGEILLFEANATMVVYPPDNDPRWDYRRPAVRRILDAIRTLLTPHAT